jgi:hypothetical protein
MLHMKSFTPVETIRGYRVSCPARAKFYAKKEFMNLQSHKRSHFPLLTTLLPRKTLRNRFQNPMFSHGVRAYSKILFHRGKRPNIRHGERRLPSASTLGPYTARRLRTSPALRPCRKLFKSSMVASIAISCQFSIACLASHRAQVCGVAACGAATCPLTGSTRIRASTI